MNERTYSSPLRQQQTEDTRRRIVEAALGLITESPQEPLSHEQIAKRAGIALRTVYRHFPVRAELLGAVWHESDRRLQLTHYPNTEQAMLDSLPALYGGMDANGSLIRGLLASNAGREMRQRDSERRRKSVENALAEATAHLPEDKRRMVLGVFISLYSGPTWQMMRDRAHLREGEVTTAVDWAMRTLLAQLRRDAKASTREGKSSPELAVKVAGKGRSKKLPAPQATTTKKKRNPS
jgi:AcrR family transcriptional regulator